MNDNWGLSFIVPGILVAAGGLLIWLFMIVKPEDVGIDLATMENQENRSDFDNTGIVSQPYFVVFVIFCSETF